MSAITRWWGRRSLWQKMAMGTGAGVLTAATGVAIVTGGMTITVVTATGTTVTLAVGKAALAAAKRLKA